MIEQQPRKPIQLPPVHINPSPNLGSETIDGKVIPFIVNPAITHPRLSIKEQFVHHLPGSNPLVIEVYTSLNLESDEQPFQRRITLGEEWTKVIGPECWIKPEDIKLLVIHNKGGIRKTQGIMSPEEKEESVSKVVEVSMSDSIPLSILNIPPLCSLPTFPEDARTWMMRCQNGSCQVVITIISK